MADFSDVIFLAAMSGRLFTINGICRKYSLDQDQVQEEVSRLEATGAIQRVSGHFYCKSKTGTREQRVTLREAAKILGTSISTARSWANQGYLVIAGAGLVTRSSVDAMSEFGAPNESKPASRSERSTSRDHQR